MVTATTALDDLEYLDLEFLEERYTRWQRQFPNENHKLDVSLRQIVRWVKLAQRQKVDRESDDVLISMSLTDVIFLIQSAKKGGNSRHITSRYSHISG